MEIKTKKTKCIKCDKRAKVYINNTAICYSHLREVLRFNVEMFGEVIISEEIVKDLIKY